MRKASRYGSPCSFTHHRCHSAETKFFSFLQLSSIHLTVFKIKQELRHGESEHWLMILSCLQKLVNETFQKLWFTPTPAHDKETMTRKILNITDVVSLSSLTLFCSVVNSQFTLNSLSWVHCKGRSLPRHRLRLVRAASTKCEHLITC